MFIEKEEYLKICFVQFLSDIDELEDSILFSKLYFLS